jgi:hypothetical protein
LKQIEKSAETQTTNNKHQTTNNKITNSYCFPICSNQYNQEEQARTHKVALSKSKFLFLLVIMRFSIALLLLLATSVREIQHANGFSLSSSSIGLSSDIRRNSLVELRSSSDVDNEVVANIDDADCGCGDTGSRTSTIFSGKPSNIAKTLNPRQAIRNG